MTKKMYWSVIVRIREDEVGCYCYRAKTREEAILKAECDVRDKIVGLKKSVSILYVLNSYGPIKEVLYG